MFAACDEGMLNARPRPTSTLMSLRSTNGRGRPMRYLIVLQTKESPGHRIKAIISTQSRPRTPPFHTNNTPARMTAGKKYLFPLANGMRTSKKELLSVWLIKRSKPTSRFRNQSTAGSLAGDGEMKTHLRNLRQPSNQCAGGTL